MAPPHLSIVLILPQALYPPPYLAYRQRRWPSAHPVEKCCLEAEVRTLRKGIVRLLGKVHEPRRLLALAPRPSVLPAAQRLVHC